MTSKSEIYFDIKLFEREIDLSEDFSIDKSILSRVDYPYGYISEVIKDKNFIQKPLLGRDVLVYQMFEIDKTTRGQWVLNHALQRIGTKINLNHALLRASHQLLVENAHVFDKCRFPIFLPHLSSLPINNKEQLAPCFSKRNKRKDEKPERIYFSILADDLITDFKYGVCVPFLFYKSELNQESTHETA